jgi:uncharacterized SAM-binding protein YcdF (DUF218 family)
MLFLTAAVPMAMLIAIWGPGFLFTKGFLKQSDAVVVFVGPGNEARLAEAKRLIMEGRARYLLIPSTGEIFRAGPGQVMERLAGNDARGALFFKIRIAANYKKYYENTHVEALEAKRMLDDLGLHSALLVSSGYHMRRIQLIAWWVFRRGAYKVACNPVRFEAPFTATDWFNSERQKILVSEYVKLAWFLSYGVNS